MSALADYARELRRQIDLFERARELDSLTLEADRSKVMAHSRHWTRQDGRRFKLQSAMDEADDGAAFGLLFGDFSEQRPARSRVMRLLVRHKKSIDLFHKRALAEAERRGFYRTMAPLLVKALKQHRRILESYELAESWGDDANFDWDRMRDVHAGAIDAFEIRLPAEPVGNIAGSAERPKGKRPDRKLPKATEARNKWIYEQCTKLVPYDTIAIRLKKKPVTWERIDSKQGIRAAAVRYAQRHNLPPIPERQE